jgi:aldehyde dehydrogenase (NAD+)
MSIKEIFTTMEYGEAPESTEQAQEWFANHKILSHYIDGQFSSDSEHCLAVINPATGEQLSQLPCATNSQVDAAVAAAAKAQPQWFKQGGHYRAKFLYALARQIQKHSRLFAVLESLDNGKPIRESRDIDIPLVIRHFYHHAGWAQTMEQQLPNYVPHGVVGQIIPWNFPLLMLAWKVAPALAMGNTVVLKPAESTSATAVLFAEICHQIGLPAGVFNLVLGAGETGESIVKHPGIQKIAFTGSTEVGRIIRRTTAGSGKKLSLELGGKSAFIVFEDADLDSAVEGLVDAIWFNQGQVCCAGSRLLMQESIAEKLIAKIKARMSKLVVGNPLNKSVDMGAIIDQTQLTKINQIVEKSVQDGAELFQVECASSTGCFYPPSLLTQVEPADEIAQQEIFGPVLVAMTFRTPSEAVQIANNSRYGLAASVWSENINLALDIAPQLKAGSVWINSTNLFDASCGFGGYRESGFGREGGIEGLMEYVQPQWLSALKPYPKANAIKPTTNKAESIDKTAKLYIGGKQCRPDSGYSLPVYDHQGCHIADIPAGNRKDIRNAVEAMNKAQSWSDSPAHLRAQILYYIAENFDAQRQRFEQRLQQLTGLTKQAANQAIELCIQRMFHAAAMADKYEGRVHNPPQRIVTLALNEPLGNLGIIAPEQDDFVGFISTLFPALAMGNRVVIIPDEKLALMALEFYQILETSDVPAGVVNIISGNREELTDTLAKHYDVTALWYFGSAQGSALVEQLSADTMKRTWVNYGKAYQWHDPQQGAGEHLYQYATEVKNVWVPYGA